MTSPFGQPVDRTGTSSLKWDAYPAGVLPMWVADMDFAAPPAVVAAVRARAAHGVFGYTATPDSLVTAIQDHLAQSYGWRIQSDWLVFLPGVVPALNLACRAYATQREAVMTVTPVYPPFIEAPRLQHRRLVTVPATLADGRWRLPLEALEATITPATKLLLFCHPHNPLGRVWEAEEVAAVVDLCRRGDLVLCSDEIHCDLLLDGQRHLPAVLAAQGAEDVTVTLMSPSKTFNLPGLNFAYAVIPDAALRRRFKAAAAGLLPMVNPLSAAAAEAAYREGGPWLADLLAFLRGNADRLEQFVADELPHVSTTHVEATYLAWLDACAKGGDPAGACAAAGVALSDGTSFGAPGFLRLNFGCSRSTLEQALARLRAALA
jgi:cystathionine beta-lyase